MTRKTAKELLAESFREVAERKNIDKITVRDITENCGYLIMRETWADSELIFPGF